jgi:hypothetical protein
MSLRFDTALKEIEIILIEENGVENTYFLRELTGAQRDKYNESFKMKVSVENKQVKAYTDKDFKMPSECFLVSLCLYNSKNELVGLEKVKSLPDRVIHALAEEANTISGLDNKADDEVKNV